MEISTRGRRNGPPLITAGISQLFTGIVAPFCRYIFRRLRWDPEAAAPSTDKHEFHYLRERTPSLDYMPIVTDLVWKTTHYRANNEETS